MDEPILTDNKPKEQIKRLDYFLLSNLFCDHAVKKYIKIYGSYIIPYSFITFFFTKCQNFSVLINDYLDAFFYTFNNNSISFDTTMQIYSKSKKPYAKLKDISKNSILLGLKKGKYIEVNRKFVNQTLTYSSDDNKKLADSIGCLELINDTLNKKCNNRTIKKEYENYINLYKKSGKTPTYNNSGKVITGTGKQVKAPPKPLITKKVSKLVLPKIELPSIYPISSTKSRVDSRYFVYRFINSARQVELLHRYRINRVKFTKGFVNKRNEAFKVSGPKNRFADFF